jgi:hypothetical protein
MAYPGIENTNSSPREPGPQTCPLEAAKGQGPPVTVGPSNSTRQRMWSEDHVKMKRSRICGMTTVGETKRSGDRAPCRVTGVLNHRIKGDALEPAPSLPPLKLSREGTLFPFTMHRCRRLLL